MTHDPSATVSRAAVTALTVGWREVGLAERERLTVATDAVPTAVRALQAWHPGTAIVATCNRFEVYVPDDVDGRTGLDAIAAVCGFDRALTARHFAVRHDHDAVRHLYRVAAGLESMALGEHEILGQVRGALRTALDAGSRDQALLRLMHGAMRAGRRARHETEIGRGHGSIFALAAQEAEEAHGDLTSSEVLLVGAGEAARRLALALQARGARRFVVANRTLSRGGELARELGGQAVPLCEAAYRAATADVIGTAIGGRPGALDRAALGSGWRAASGAPVVVLDMGVPRDIPTELRACAGIYYVDVESLTDRARSVADARRAEVPRVERIVDEEVGRFERWSRNRGVLSTVAALSEHAERVRVEQLEKTVRRLRPDEATQQRLDALTRALVKQMLHKPIAALRADGGDAHADAARALFGID